MLTTHALKIPGAMLDGARLILGAKLRGRRFISDGATVKLQLNVAQDWPSCSRVTLGERVDAMGMPEVVVDWRVSEQEVGTMRKYAGHLREQFEAMGLTGVEWSAGMLDEWGGGGVGGRAACDGRGVYGHGSADERGGCGDAGAWGGNLVDRERGGVSGWESAAAYADDDGAGVAAGGSVGGEMA